MKTTGLITRLAAPLLVLLAAATASAETTTATGIGNGATQAEACANALRDAKLQAVQQVTGVRVTQTGIRGVELQFYQVFVETRGAIERFEEIGEPTMTDATTCQRTIRAEVREIDDEALAQFIRQIRRVGIYIKEPLRGENPAAAALQQALTERGYQVVDLTGAGREVETLLTGRDRRPLLRRNLVDAVITATDIRLVSGSVGEEGGMAGVISRRAEGAARMVFVNQPEVPFDAVESTRAVGPRENRPRLERRALQNYGQRLAQIFGDALDAHFPATALSVILETVPDIATYTGVVRSIQALLPGTQVVAGDYSPQTATIIVNFPEGQDPEQEKTRVAGIVESSGARVLSMSQGAVRAEFASGAAGEQTARQNALTIDIKWLVIGGLGVIAIVVIALVLKRR